MCLILFAHKAHADYPLVIAANRDESYARPTAQAAFWDDEPRIYGGRDLEQGGTWLGVNCDGAIAAVTNFRSSDGRHDSSRSRGELVANFLRTRLAPAAYMQQVTLDAGAYNGFNLLAGNVSELHWLSNRGIQPERVTPGVHGLSNHLLDTPWPKVERGKKRLTELLQSRTPDLIENLFALVAERSIAPDDALPATGVGIERERVLSPAFIVSPAYGTRSSTVVLIDNNGELTFAERSFSEGGEPAGSARHKFLLKPPITAAPA